MLLHSNSVGIASAVTTQASVASAEDVSNHGLQRQRSPPSAPGAPDLDAVAAAIAASTSRHSAAIAAAATTHASSGSAASYTQQVHFSQQNTSSNEWSASNRRSNELLPRQRCCTMPPSEICQSCVYDVVDGGKLIKQCTDWLLHVLQRHAHADHKTPPAAEPAADEVDFAAERAFWKQLLAADPAFQQQVSLLAEHHPCLRWQIVYIEEFRTAC